MAKQCHAIIPAVFMLFKREGRILLGRRQGGWGAGLLCPPGGHVEAGESFSAAAIREAREEIGVELEAKSLIPYHIMHRKNAEEQERIDVYFLVEAWQGELVNNEPSKCSELVWVPESAIPADCVEIFTQGFNLAQKGVLYSEDWAL